ncbi:GAF domain-containing protein [Nocardioides marinquilinus]|uniref:GAF domain-containing protein n=1 Tax=Nocardioides marinquilinus TaxID=1210400 RepID=A0ABP9P9L8_9ACTN
MHGDEQRAEGGSERERLERLVAAQQPTGRRGRGLLLDRLCATAVAELDLCAAAVSHPPTDGTHLVAAASDDAARRLEELQFDVGEGPTHDACRERRPVLVPSLDDRALQRWPGFVQAAASVGVAAVFTFPLHVGAALLGALALYRATAGGLSGAEVRTALTLADLTVEAMIDLTLDDDTDAPPFVDALDGQAHVYQAQGIVMVQLGVSLTEALALMRGRAHAEGLSLADLSRAIIDGTASFGQDGTAP